MRVYTYYFANTQVSRSLNYHYKHLCDSTLREKTLVRSSLTHFACNSLLPLSTQQLFMHAEEFICYNSRPAGKVVMET